MTRHDDEDRAQRDRARQLTVRELITGIRASAIDRNIRDGYDR